MIYLHFCYLMLLCYWRGCGQGPGYTSKYGNLPKSDEKITEKMLCTNFFIFSAFPSSLLQDFLLFLYLDLDPEHSPLCHKKYYSHFFPSFFSYFLLILYLLHSIFQTALYIWMWALNPGHSLIDKVATTATIHIFRKRFPQGYHLNQWMDWWKICVSPQLIKNEYYS